MKLFSMNDIIFMFDISNDNSSIANALSYFKNVGRLIVKGNNIKTGIVVEIDKQKFLYLCECSVKTFKKQLLNQGFIFI